MRIVAEVVKLSNGMLLPRLYCIGEHGAEECSVTDTLLLLVSESSPRATADLSELLTEAEAGTYKPADPDLPDWGLNDKNVWVVPPMTNKGTVRISNEHIEPYSDEYGEPQEFSIQQVRAVIQHWARFQAILAEKGKENLVGVKLETTID
jgi:hypothetical protein